jgi:OOP family OmpA-OmpF porin
MNRKIQTLILSLFIFSATSFAQSYDKKFGIEINGGLKEYHGDLGSALYFKNSPDYQGIGGAFGIYLNPSFDANLYGSTGDVGFYKMEYNERLAETVRVGFRSRVLQGMLGVTYKFANGYLLAEDARFKPFLRAGWGVTQSISKFTEYSVLPDYSQNRTWISSAWNAGGGFKFGLTDALDLVVSEQLNYTFDDNFDAAPWSIAGARLNVAQEGNKPLHDMFLYHSIGFAYNFGSNGASYKIKDSDDDGISDDFDVCPNTPEGYEVDTAGCPLDNDKDGIVNEEDKCPNVKGVAAFDGCPDSDGDGIADAEDKCPDVPGLAAFAGCPDSDKDGIQDSEDKCPLKSGSKEGEGCPDSDGDGVYDHKDVCPANPGAATNKGCPEIKEEVKEQIALAAKGIYFESGRDMIKAESFASLDQLSKILQEYDKAKVTIEGHTDSQGEADANQALSQKRADAVKRYLASHGISAARMTAIGYGQSQPLVDNSTAAGRALNRRVDFKLVH